ncbi:MAG: FHA domain-containing protein, partial [bacterium]
MPEIIVKLGEEVVGKYFFDKEVISIGRARDNDIVIENLSVSRNHARIRRADDKYVITDLNSANGVFVNGVRVTKTEVLHSDVITIGKHKVIFQEPAPVTREEEISEAFGADRTMLVDRIPTAVLVVTKGKQKDQTFELTKYENSIGRAPDNDCALTDWFVSKRHAMIVREGQNFFIKDLGSWRRTMLNGKYITESQVKDGDLLQFGTTQIRFSIRKEAEMAPAMGRQPKELAMDDSFGPYAAPPESAPEAAAAAAPVGVSQALEGEREAQGIKDGGKEEERDRFAHLQTRAIGPSESG